MVEIDIKERTISLFIRNRIFFSIGDYKLGGKVTIMIYDREWDKLTEKQKKIFTKFKPRFYSG